MHLRLLLTQHSFALAASFPLLYGSVVKEVIHRRQICLNSDRSFAAIQSNLPDADIPPVEVPRTDGRDARFA